MNKLQQHYLRKFDLQIFGGGGGGSRQVRKRDPMTPEHEMLNAAMYNAIMPIIGRYTGQSFAPSGYTPQTQEQANKQSSLGSSSGSYYGPPAGHAYNDASSQEQAAWREEYEKRQAQQAQSTTSQAATTPSAPAGSGGYDAVVSGGKGGGTTSQAATTPLMQNFDTADRLTNLANQSSEQAFTAANNAMNTIGKYSGTADKYMGDAMNYLAQHQDLLNRGTNAGLENAMKNMNVSVMDTLNQSMGAGLNDWANRGVINSSVANRGLQTMQDEASKAAASNWGNMYNTMLGNYLGGHEAALSGHGAALSGQDNALNAYNSYLQGLQTYAGLPQQYYQNAIAPLMPGYNFWKDTNQMYYGHEDFDTIVNQGK